MRTGIFGGTFNPVHKGHTNALDCFIRSAKLDRVYIIPTYSPPHKEMPSESADFDERLEMCRIAFSELETECELIFTDIEKRLCLETGERNYTYITVQRLMEKEDTLCLYVGTDMFLILDKWKNADLLLSSVEVWVMPRCDEKDSEIPSFKKALEEKFPQCRINVIGDPPTDASSTEIRSGNFGLLNSGVREYIVKKGFYK